jgi:hypothetical protein
MYTKLRFTIFIGWNCVMQLFLCLHSDTLVVNHVRMIVTSVGDVVSIVSVWYRMLGGKPETSYEA